MIRQEAEARGRPGGVPVTPPSRLQSCADPVSYTRKLRIGPARQLETGRLARTRLGHGEQGEGGG